MTQQRGLPAAAVAAPADKRFRRAETRPGRRGGAGFLRSRGFRWSVAGVLVLGLAATAWSYTVRAEIFTIDRVVVRGNTRLSTGEVLAIVEGLRGGSVFTADLAAFRAKLLDSPWVADVTMRRILPSTVDLRIVERVPIATARLGQQLYLVDAAGWIIDEFGPQYASYDLPIVDGMVAAPGSTEIDPARARLAARVLDAFSTPALSQRVAEIDVTDAHDVVVLVDQDPALLHLGDRDFGVRLQRYLELAPTLKDQLRDIDYVDLRFDERIYVRSKHSATTVVAKGQ
jgi:cell division protein FtsQ